MRIVLQGGDNMLGRAIQLTLPHQTEGDEQITDSQRAVDYLDDILPNVDIESIREQNYDGSYLWGDLPYDLGEDVRIINLEAAPTFSITTSRKTIHYHLNINNIPHVFAKFTRPYVLALANNHSMDMGRLAFTEETLPNITNAVGIGTKSSIAYSPRIVGNIAILAFGAGCAGIPAEWGATMNKAGIAYLPPIVSEANVNRAFAIIKSITDSIGDKFIIISIHWGPNWAHNNDGQKYRVMLAHLLIDGAGVDMIHGHSSHHIRGIELYKSKLILYGAGDFINDYEMIPSLYNTDGALYVIDINETDYSLQSLELIPCRTKYLQWKTITDKTRINSLISHINSQSIKDSSNPLLMFDKNY